MKWKKVKKAEGYVIQVSEKKSFKKVTYKTKAKKNSCVLKKKALTAKTVYVRVRSYAEDEYGDKVYSGWSKVKKVTVK